MKILSVFGTRPEAVKMAPVIRELAQTPNIESRVCVTAQHRQMLDQVLNLFDIKPDYDLNLMREDQSLAELSAAIFTHLDPIFSDFRPDWVLVQGDTTTVAITALLAYYRRIRVGHVEAGLRTHDKWQPFPEEINRRVAGVIADLHFAPTEWTKQNLLREGISEKAIAVTGNPVIDALQFAAKQPEPEEIAELLGKLGIGNWEFGQETHFGNCSSQGKFWQAARRDLQRTQRIGFTRRCGNRLSSPSQSQCAGTSLSHLERCKSHYASSAAGLSSAG